MAKEVIYRQAGLPVFQNKVYPTPESAKLAVVGDVELVQCAHTGLVHNDSFDSALLRYDKDYQNEQACSPVFKLHLESVLQIIMENVSTEDMGVEIGCGKGYFLEKLSEAGAKVVGYDPAYEGSNPLVFRTYFGEDTIKEAPDYIVLRHVLEHISSPWSFLKRLALQCKTSTKIYIEVPCFDWIVQNNAFYDVFYEHVNYFTLDVFQQAFAGIIKSGKLFGGQYLYMIAHLSSFEQPSHYVGKRYKSLPMYEYLDELLLKRFDRLSEVFVWGAGAKGVTFSNILARRGIGVSAIIDINPAKQGRFAGLSGIPIVSPSSALPCVAGADVFVMNPVYLNEVKAMFDTLRINWIPVA